MCIEVIIKQARKPSAQRTNIVLDSKLIERVKTAIAERAHDACPRLVDAGAHVERLYRFSRGGAEVSEGEPA
jgi:hypothetical protein